jgi:hypothetical protein
VRELAQTTANILRPVIRAGQEKLYSLSVAFFFRRRSFAAGPCCFPNKAVPHSFG